MAPGVPVEAAIPMTTTDKTHLRLFFEKRSALAAEHRVSDDAIRVSHTTEGAVRYRNLSLDNAVLVRQNIRSGRFFSKEQIDDDAI